MKCTKVRRLLSDLIDGNVDPGTNARLKAHLAQCENCRNVYQKLSQINDALRVGRPPTELPPGQQEQYWSGFWPRLQSRLQSTSSEPARVILFPGWQKLAAAAAGLLVCVLMGLLGLRAHRLVTSLRAELDAAHAKLQELRPVAPRPARVASVVSADLAARDAALFQETDATFSGGLRWVATDGEKIDLGMSHNLSPLRTPAAAAPERLLAVQLAIFASGQGQDRLLNRTRIVARDGCRAEFSTDAGGAGIHYECLGMIQSAAEADLRLRVGIGEVEGQPGSAIDTALSLRSHREAEVARLIWKQAHLVVRVGLVIVRNPEPLPRIEASKCGEA